MRRAVTTTTSLQCGGCVMSTSGLSSLPSSPLFFFKVIYLFFRVKVTAEHMVCDMIYKHHNHCLAIITDCLPSRVKGLLETQNFPVTHHLSFCVLGQATRPLNKSDRRGIGSNRSCVILCFSWTEGCRGTGPKPACSESPKSPRRTLRCRVAGRFGSGDMCQLAAHSKWIGGRLEAGRVGVLAVNHQTVVTHCFFTAVRKNPLCHSSNNVGRSIYDGDYAGHYGAQVPLFKKIYIYLTERNFHTALSLNAISTQLFQLVFSHFQFLYDTATLSLR